VYQEILAGRGFGIADARPSIQLVYEIRNARPANETGHLHPFLLPKNGKKQGRELLRA
jgi:UDP-N-acetyl-2-amino-2-deoxyglucuronate dehydrogenase